MKAWTARPKEEAHLLNPALCCSILAAAARGYMSAKRGGVPFPLMFLVLPIVLHKPTRDSLPQDTRTSMAAWLQDNASARVMFYERLASLKPYTREAIHFGLLFEWFALRAGGLLEATVKEFDNTRVLRKLADDARVCVMRARFLGKWFAEAGSPLTVMALWGVRP